MEMVLSEFGQQEGCNHLQLDPLFQRFAIKSKEKDHYGKGREPDILYSVEKIEGRLLITNATHVKWNSSGETGVWPSR